MHDVFLRYLKTKRLKVTGQRKTVLKAFLGVKSHVSVEELYTRVKKQDSSIGQATVFRVMKLLAEAGIAQTSGLGERGVRYEPKRTHHDHLICGNCGAIVEFTNEVIEKEQDKIAADYSFTLSDHRMELYGQCLACRSKKKTKRKA